jgi:hypothetical protein
MAEPQHKKQIRKSDHSWVFLLFFIVGAMILFLFESTPSKKQEVKNPAASSSPVFDESDKMNRVNRHMKETAIQLESDRLRRAQETQIELQKLRAGATEEVHRPESGLTFENDRSMDQLSAELNRSHAITEDQLTPEQIVQNRLLELRLQQNEDQAYREEYARQFIENARAGGWDVKLGPNFEVLSVRKLKPRKPSLFDSAPEQ